MSPTKRNETHNWILWRNSSATAATVFDVEFAATQTNAPGWPVGYEQTSQLQIEPPERREASRLFGPDKACSLPDRERSAIVRRALLDLETIASAQPRVGRGLRD
ncbi:hypothetical protein D3C76_1555600 [compost metagenome]